jgi:hypothetical protein
LAQREPSDKPTLWELRVSPETLGWIGKQKNVSRDLSRQYPVSRQTDCYFIHEHIGLISTVIHENRIIGRGRGDFSVSVASALAPNDWATLYAGIEPY